MQDLHGRLRGAGREAGLRVGENTGQGEIGAAVDVLGRVQHLSRLLVVELLGKRPEQKDAVDAVVLVDFLKRFVKGFLGDIHGKNDVLHFDPHGLRALGGAALIGQIVRTFAHSEDAEGRVHALRLKFFHILLHLRGQRVRYFLAFQNSGHLLLLFVPCSPEELLPWYL